MSRWGRCLIGMEHVRHGCAWLIVLGMIAFGLALMGRGSLVIRRHPQAWSGELASLIVGCVFLVLGVWTVRSEIGYHRLLRAALAGDSQARRKVAEGRGNTVKWFWRTNGFLLSLGCLLAALIAMGQDGTQWWHWPIMIPTLLLVAVLFLGKSIRAWQS